MHKIMLSTQIAISASGLDGSHTPFGLRPVRLLRVSIPEGLTQANSQFEGVGIPMSVEFDRGSPGKFESRTPNRKTLSRWTGRSCFQSFGYHCCDVLLNGCLWLC